MHLSFFFPFGYAWRSFSIRSGMMNPMEAL